MTPVHLQILERFDPLPFQRLWKAYQRAQVIKGCRDKAFLMKRRAVAQLSVAYQEAIDRIQGSLCNGLRLENCETGVARAWKILYIILYPDIQNSKTTTSRSNYEIRHATPCYQFR